MLLATQAPVLLRLEDDWALGLTRRDSALFRQLLADGFVYTKDDKDRRFGTTAIVTGWLVVGGRGPQGKFSRRCRFTDTWRRRGAVGRLSPHTTTWCPPGSLVPRHQRACARGLVARSLGSDR